MDKKWRRVDIGRNIAGEFLGYWEDEDSMALVFVKDGNWSVSLPGGEHVAVESPSHWMVPPVGPYQYETPEVGDSEDDVNENPCGFCLRRDCNGECGGDMRP